MALRHTAHHVTQACSRSQAPSESDEGEGEEEKKKGDSRGFDGDAPLLLVLPRVGEPGLAGLGAGDDARLGHEGVGQC